MYYNLINKVIFLTTVTQFFGFYIYFSMNIIILNPLFI